MMRPTARPCQPQDSATLDGSCDPEIPSSARQAPSQAGRRYRYESSTAAGTAENNEKIDVTESHSSQRPLRQQMIVLKGLDNISDQSGRRTATGRTRRTPVSPSCVQAIRQVTYS
ncbi:hypothetical protein [Amycolatopsis sp. EV170708-02-1]|uniref:hypothetical protein n=1 Tax=Amycolatopsis sp. EV170708-02-1 TaxID=2919322 RepID=UPI001F0B9CD8|nr:hypothetical protein [Amycolatopsis sp. EV170708-02-1]UMP07241.1 hypothetical protein MJQ72_21590 [Amycolatopsis sp. EV170708-02-1]